MKQTKNCLFCKYFVIDLGYGPLSEVTPGMDVTIVCNNYDNCRFYLDVSPGGDSQEKITESMLTAMTCEDFELSDTAKKMKVEIIG